MKQPNLFDVDAAAGDVVAIVGRLERGNSDARIEASIGSEFVRPDAPMPSSILKELARDSIDSVIDQAVYRETARLEIEERAIFMRIAAAASPANSEDR